MLVLSRRVGERIIIGQDVCIEVVAVTSGNRVRVGITAPAGVEIWREELWLDAASQAAKASCAGKSEPRHDLQESVA